MSEIYLAARYSRRVELCEYKADLIALGHTVPARWLLGNHQADALTVETTDRHGPDGVPLIARQFADEDLDDLITADVLISFTEPPRTDGGSRGGRHVEFGVALGWRACGEVGDPWIYIVGPRENVFHTLDYVDGVFADWPSCRDHIGKAAP